MGPRSVGRGKVAQPQSALELYQRFNGAPVCWPGKVCDPGQSPSPVQSLQWGPGLLAGERRSAAGMREYIFSFNGAPVCWPGKGRRLRRMRSCWLGFNGAPVCWPGKGSPSPSGASAGPRSFNGAPVCWPGKGCRRPRRPGTAPCFNGAPVCWPGKAFERLTGAIVKEASMGPRSVGRGKEGNEPLSEPSAVLQWGPGLLAGERRRRRRDLAADELASMGPRSVGRGKGA